MDAPFETLERFRAWQRALPHVGPLIGASLAQRDRHFEREWQAFQRAMAEALPGDPLDFSGVSLVLAGDTVRLWEGGKRDRQLTRYPEDFLKPAQPVTGQPAPLWNALTCFFHALWLPSATNWQPMRVLRLGDGWRLVRRRRYQSLLGDILDLYGLAYPTSEDRIDAGIYLEGVLRSARVQGLGVSWQPSPETAAHPWDPAQFVPFVDLQLTGEGEMPTWFEALSLGRASQRVASPKPLERDALLLLWQEACAAVGVPEGLVAMQVYEQDARVPQLIGQSMHEALYGEAGFLSRMTPERLRQDQPLGTHLQERLGEREEPLSVRQLARLSKGLATTFGRYFLRFRHTHPLTSVLLVRDATGYVWLGRVVAVMCWLARARGYSAIVKSGPVILARARIQEILATSLVPALTFQMGWPLGLDDEVDGHSGLDERRLDKRPPRADLTCHLQL